MRATLALALVVTALGFAGAVWLRSRPAADGGAGGNHVPAAPGHAAAVVAEIASVADAASHLGRWYVADPRNRQVHLLDSAGQHVRSIGRYGRGPGEFLSPAQVAANDAHVYVAEAGRPAISVFGHDGAFVEQLSAPRGCAAGGVAALAARARELYVLRRCLELPVRITFRVERSRAGSGLEVWESVADTIALLASGAIPLHYPLFSINDRYLVVGEGGAACLRIVQLADGAAAGRRCLHEVPRLEWPEADHALLSKRWSGRVLPPDSLPRAFRVALLDTSIAVQAVEGMERASWYVLPWSRVRTAEPVAVGRRDALISFIAADHQLVAWDDAAGVRVEVIRVER